MAEEAPPSLEELQANLRDYEEQLEQVGQLLLDDPENKEYKGIYESLAEVIALTKELIADAQAVEPAQPVAPAAAPQQQQQQQAPLVGAAVPPPLGAAAITQAPEVRLPSVLPPQVAQQIKDAQQRAALAGQAPAAWAIGALCQAVYSGDGQWYDGVVEAVSASGNFVVAFEGYDTREEVERQSVRARPAAESVDEGYRPVSAPRRHRVADEVQLQEMPKWLEIKETDDVKTMSKKRKLQKSFKSKARFAKMDLEQKQKADSWRAFVGGKASKKKAGFMTSLKRESMFKVPEGGKVGVIGSGKGVTEYAKRKRHEFDAAADD